MSIDYLERPALVLGTDLKTGEHTRLLEGLVAIVTGGVLMKVHGVAALGMVHRIGAAAFVVLLLALYIPKWKK